MNLLRIQDALKNASDQQLMQLMQAPDSTAPSYLVLSEIRRRKDMRAKQAPQEGQSNRTVAEELTAPEDQGIRSMQMPEEPPQDVSDQSGIEAMREGGVVRMQAGGNIMGDIPFPPSSYEDMTVPPAFGGPGPSAPSAPDYQTRLAAAQREFRTRIEQDPRLRTDSVLQARIAQQFNVPLTFARDLQRQEGIRIAREGPATVGGQSGVAPLGMDAPMAPQIAPLSEDEPRGAQQQAQADAERGRAVSDLQANLPARPNVEAERSASGAPPGGARPAGGGAGGGGGGGGGTPAAAASTEAGLPTMADIYRQNQGLFADGIAALRERAQQERVDPAARRSEAVNMALIEAGLRIAGSRNPSLVGAIGEGALPAVQSYGQQLGQIRAEQREARRDELELAKQELNRQFAVGQISATEFRTRMDNITRTNIADRQERMAGIRAAEGENRMDQRAQIQARLQADDLRRRGYYTPEELAAMSPQQRALVQEQRSMGRPLDTAGAGTVLNATIAEIGRIRTEMDADPAPRPTSSGYAEWQRRDAERRERLRVADERRTRLEDVVFLGRGAAGQTGGATNLPSGGRIVNGQYVPAGS